jgi:hypothetical protein
MSRKSLFFGSIVLILAMLFALAGCKDPVAGPQGPRGDQGDQGKQGDTGRPGNTVQGDPGGGGLSGAVTAVDLDVAFSKSDEVILLSNVTSVYGVVPANKKLIVLGNTLVADGKELKLESGAVLEVFEGAVLQAINLNTKSGALTGPGASVEGAGAVILPVDLSILPNGPYTGSLHWDSDQIASSVARYPGSASTAGGAPVQLTSAFIGEIFITYAPLSELTVLDIEDLEPVAIPEGKKLTLVGTGNTITDGTFTLNQNSKLTVGAGAVLTIGVFNASISAFESNSDAVFTNNGTVELITYGGDFSTIIPNGGVITNNNTINSESTDEDDIKPLLAATGTGTIVLTPAGVVNFTDDVPLNQHLVLGGGQRYVLNDSPRPFTGFAADRTITINSGATLVLGGSTIAIGTTNNVTNNGIIETATTDTKVLGTIFGETGNKGEVTAIGDVTVTTSVPAAFTIPKDIILNLETGDPTLAGVTSDFIVAGILNVLEDDTLLVPIGNITISGTVNLDDDGSSLTIATGTPPRILTITSTALFDGEGVLSQADTTSIIKIDDGEGELPGSYSLGTGVAGEDFADALNAIRTTRNLLTDSVSTAGSTFADYDLVIGTVDVTTDLSGGGGPSPGGPHPIYPTKTAADATPITLLPGTVVTNTGLAVLPTLGTTSTYPFLSSTTFTLGITANVLTLSDSGLAGGVDKFGVLRFNSYTITNGELTSPTLTKLFHIGVKSKRAL